MDLFNEPTGKELKEKGMQQAIDHANEVAPKWSEQAYKFLQNYLQAYPGIEFMCEDVRKASEGIVPEPPTTRAWGGVMRSAKYNNLIKHVRLDQVSNPKAHAANASVWKSANN